MKRCPNSWFILIVHIHDAPALALHGKFTKVEYEHKYQHECAITRTSSERNKMKN